jgi:adenine deaminase
MVMGLGRTLENLNGSLRSAARRMSLGGVLDPLMKSPRSAGNEIALINCRVFDGVLPTIREDMTLLVKDGRILDAGHREENPIPKTFRVVDVEGRTIMPGLIDAHVHQCSPFS